jgi:cell wall-associated NlpC family hydrolase
MRKILISLLIPVLVPALACAAQSPSGPVAAVVKSAVENMHSRPDASSDVVSQAILGTNVKLLKKERNADGEDWYHAETPDAYKGWIASSALVILKPEDKPYAAAGKVFVVSALLANTYREPDVTKRKPVKVAPISAVLEIAAEKDERWLEVRLPCGTAAWIQRGDGVIREAPWTWPRTPVEDLVALSKRFLGLPYLWGGTSPLGVDCSGFVQLLYRMSGVPILRDADIQFEGSGLAEVAPGEERAGDLVFFGRAKDRISHVGMMIGPDEFINATTYQTPVVRIDRLSEPRWQKLYQGARRPKAEGFSTANK